MLDYKLAYGSRDSWETILASAGGFIFSYKDIYTYDIPTKAGHAQTWTRKSREGVKHA